MKRSSPFQWLLPRLMLLSLPGLLALLGGCSDDGDPALDPDDPNVVDVGGPGGRGGSGGGGGNSNGSWPEVPPLRDAVTLGDDALARQALGLLGSSAVNGQGNCKNCHSLGRPTLTRWSKLTQEFTDACLDNPDLENQAAVDRMFDCFQTRSTGQYAPEGFGIYSAAAHLPWFDFVFEHASRVASARQEEDGFRSRVGMPRAGEPWTQDEFDIVAEWFARKVPRLLELVPEDAGEDCTPGLDPLLAEHVQELATSGWRARNARQRC